MSEIGKEERPKNWDYHCWAEGCKRTGQRTNLCGYTVWLLCTQHAAQWELDERVRDLVFEIINVDAERRVLAFAKDIVGTRGNLLRWRDAMNELKDLSFEIFGKGPPL